MNGYKSGISGSELVFLRLYSFYSKKIVGKSQKENLLPVQNEDLRTVIEWPAANDCFSILLRSQLKTFTDCKEKIIFAYDTFFFS